ncbi:MAG: MFS transporter [Rhodospirillales bacterium]|nr:MFS transporter [Rhodospirillales bacterium]
MIFLRNRALLILICGALILSLSMGIRQSFGLFLEPMSHSLGWKMGVFSLALAMQNLLWGLLQPVTGMLADKYGTTRTLVAGAALYLVGTMVMAFSSTQGIFHLGAGLLVGMGVAATGFPMVLSAVGRATPPAKRPAALGLAAAGGSFGQFAMAPVSQGLIDLWGWSAALVVLALMSGTMALLALPLRGKAEQTEEDAEDQTITQAVSEASRVGSFWLLNAGFFVCGFHVAFIATHLPMYLSTCNMPPMLSATALALIGFCNMIGTYMAGRLGTRYRMKYLLSGIYLGRAIIIALFLALPVTQTTVLLFSAGMGFLWLGTVPLTSGIVAAIFGPRYMATLFGIVLASHQVGAFLGAWMGGYLYDTTGGYDGAWITAIGLGLFAAAINLPIVDRSLRKVSSTA